ncbi:MAG TPA: nicotinate-nucleotide adenylyltransferase, partial [Caulobacteraceae bacterium]|nr:nicotinate-nucleotide adenylyltransferase [Caulobacteraceae bacterium]
LARRLSETARLARGPKMIVSDVEARLGTRYTIDTIRLLQRRFPGVEFVWIMGSDNLASFHHWKDWRGIAKSVALAVVPRPGFSVRSAPAARLLKVRRLHAPLNAASSTALRAHASVTTLS